MPHAAMQARPSWRPRPGPCLLPARPHLQPTQVLQELAGDQSLERFRIEYEKLFRALRKTHGAALKPPACAPLTLPPAIHGLPVGENLCRASCAWQLPVHDQLSILSPSDNEKRLVKKCRELNSEIVSNAAKVQAALSLSDEDQATIIALKKEIEKAWKTVDASHDKVRMGRQPRGATRGGHQQACRRQQGVRGCKAACWQ